jgi:hypothetical protein
MPSEYRVFDCPTGTDIVKKLIEQREEGFKFVRVLRAGDGFVLTVKKSNNKEQS